MVAGNDLVLALWGTARCSTETIATLQKCGLVMSDMIGCWMLQSNRRERDWLNRKMNIMF